MLILLISCLLDICSLAFLKKLLADCTCKWGQQGWVSAPSLEFKASTPDSICGLVWATKTLWLDLRGDCDYVYSLFCKILPFQSCLLSRQFYLPHFLFSYWWGTNQPTNQPVQTPCWLQCSKDRSSYVKIYDACKGGRLLSTSAGIDFQPCFIITLYVFRFGAKLWFSPSLLLLISCRLIINLMTHKDS